MVRVKRFKRYNYGEWIPAEETMKTPDGMLFKAYFTTKPGYRIVGTGKDGQEWFISLYTADYPKGFDYDAETDEPGLMYEYRYEIMIGDRKFTPPEIVYRQGEIKLLLDKERLEDELRELDD